MKKFSQPWLADPAKEIIFILAPALLPVAVIFAFQDYFINHQEVNSLWWVLLVLCIDVGHVYSTLFRLYWDKPTFVQYKKVLILIPVVALIVGFMLHLYSGQLFWRILAYIAVFHFIRQQYGFMRLYSRRDKSTQFSRWVDGVTIYAGTIYPLIYWHLHLTKNLSWFVPGDFISIPVRGLDNLLLSLYLTIIGVYILKEVIAIINDRHVNIPKNLIVLGTYLSWYVGIVMFEGDLIFTLLNVVAHGIPYMGLVWIYGEKKASQAFSFTGKGVLTFVVVLLAFAYFEEGLWDILVWKDHPEVFPFLTEHAAIENPVLLSLAVPLLVLPQVTHYVLDGFIWRFSKDVSARITE